MRRLQAIVMLHEIVWRYHPVMSQLRLVVQERKIGQMEPPRASADNVKALCLCCLGSYDDNENTVEAWNRCHSLLGQDHAFK